MAEGGVKISPRAMFAEFLAMTIFVWFGCGSAMSDYDISTVAFVFGLAIVVLVYTVGHTSGGHVNCAVTLGLVVAGKCEAMQGFVDFAGQIMGSIFGALLIGIFIAPEDDRSNKSVRAGMMGTNSISDRDVDYETYRGQKARAFLGEFLCTAFLMYVVLQTACSAKAEKFRACAPLAIGFSVFLGHLVLIPMTGCSINPSRSFGPVLMMSILSRDYTDNAAIPEHIGSGDDTVAFRPAGYSFGKVRDTFVWGNHWLFWLAPLLGAATASVLYHNLNDVAVSTLEKAGDNIKGHKDNIKGKVVKRITKFESAGERIAKVKGKQGQTEQNTSSQV